MIKAAAENAGMPDYYQNLPCNPLALMHFGSKADNGAMLVDTGDAIRFVMAYIIRTCPICCVTYWGDGASDSRGWCVCQGCYLKSIDTSESDGCVVCQLEDNQTLADYRGDLTRARYLLALCKPQVSNQIILTRYVPSQPHIPELTQYCQHTIVLPNLSPVIICI